jgi:hypothetical protein
MFRRLSSLRRVAVDCSLSLFHGYYPDAKTSRHPSRRASFSFAWRYHGCAGVCSHPAPTRCPLGRGVGLRRPPQRKGLPFACAADFPWGWPDLSSSRRTLCRYAHAPTTPEEPERDSPSRPAGTAPEQGTPWASSMTLSKLNRMAWRLAVYASPWRSSAPDARLACGCWLSSAARDSDPLSSKERFRLCVDHISSSSSRELAWRNPRLFFGRMACSPAVALASCGKPTDC